MQSRIFATKCQLCEAPVVMAVRRDLPSRLVKVIINKQERITYCHPSEPHASGLCFFHLKQAQGLFDAKYPIEKNGPAESQMTVMKEAMMRALGHKPSTFRQNKKWQDIMREMR